MPDRRSWPYLKTPLAIFLIVMLPVCGLELVLLATDSPNWMRISAGLVLLITAYAGARGYLRRLYLDPRGAELRSIFRTIRIHWNEVRRVDCYAPNGIGGTQFVYITTRDQPPAGTWDIGPDVIQLQDQPGLLDAIESARPRIAGQSQPPES